MGKEDALDDKNKEFNKKADAMFEQKLKCEEVDVIRVRDVEKNEILENINYGFLLFDANLNMYKWNIEKNSYLPVNNINFKPIIVKKFKK